MLPRFFLPSVVWMTNCVNKYIIFKFTIPLHWLHRYHNWLIYNTSPCNDKQKYHVTDVTFISEWHQWHEKNKHITHGNIDIQRFIVFVLWVQWNNGSKFFLNNSQLYSENIYLWRNNILIRALHCKKENVYLQCPAGEIAGHIRKRFLLYPKIRNRQFQTRRIETIATLILYICI